MTRLKRFVALFAAGLVGSSAQAGSSLNVVLTVILSSGPCGASVGTDAVSVSCGLAALPALPPVTSLARAGGGAQQAFIGGSFGASAPPFVSIASGGSSGGAAAGIPTGFSPASAPGFSPSSSPSSSPDPSSGAFPGASPGSSPSPSPETSPGFPDGSPADPARRDDSIAERFLQELAGWEGSESGDQRLRRVGVLPAWATGHNQLAVYSSGANLSSWRVVSNDNAQHVELTISW